MKYRVNRKIWQPIWEHITEGTGVLEGYCVDFENSTFEVRPYSWSEDYHNNEYHFWHKPSGFKLYWYKYPLRDSWANINITTEQFIDILYDCVNSLQVGKIKSIHDVDIWWV